MSSFFKKLFKRTSSQEASLLESLPTAAELRLYPRYKLTRANQITMLFQDGYSAVIEDISYGGFAIARNALPDHTPLVPKTIKICGIACAVDAYEIHRTQDFIGFAFRHTTMDLLVFLRQFLETLRMGTTCLQLKNDLLNPPYNNKDWFYFRGEGPTDIILNNNSAAPQEAVIMYSRDGVYHQVRITNHAIFTGQTVATAAGESSTQIEETPVPTHLTVATGYLLLSVLTERGLIQKDNVFLQRLMLQIQQLP